MYLVTGGAGFIGSHLARALVERGERVRVVDDLSTGKESNLAGLRGGVELVVGDIRDASVMARATRGVEVVLHQAALPSVTRSITDPRSSLDSIVLGTLTTLEAAVAAGVRRVVQASSCAVYGDGPTLPQSVDARPLPRSPYAAAKLAAETLGQALSVSHDLEVVALRYFNVFGPGQDAQSDYAAVIPRFISAVRESRPVTIFGDGEQSRDFTYVADVVAANLLAADASGISGEVFNIATGRATTVNETLASICEHLGAPALPVFAAARPGEIRASLADIEPARQRLGYRPATDFGDGIRRTIAAIEAASA